MSINYKEFLDYLDKLIAEYEIENCRGDMWYNGKLLCAEDIKKEFLRNHKEWKIEQENRKYEILNELVNGDLKSSALLADKKGLLVNHEEWKKQNDHIS